jgi:excisionase family DNA binding protein
VSRALAKRQPAANTNDAAPVSSSETRDAAADLVWVRSRELMDRIAVEVFKGVVAAVECALRGETVPPQTMAPSDPATSNSDVMTADEVAEFLGVDRNTVYDFAGRGEIPHRRLGKRLLFRRGAVVSWLDTSLCDQASKRSA